MGASSVLAMLRLSPKHQPLVEAKVIPSPKPSPFINAKPQTPNLQGDLNPKP